MDEHAHLNFAVCCSPVFADEDTEEWLHVREACGARFKQYGAQTSSLLLSLAQFCAIQLLMSASSGDFAGHASLETPAAVTVTYWEIQSQGRSQKRKMISRRTVVGATRVLS